MGEWRIDGDKLCTLNDMNPTESCIAYPTGKKPGDEFKVTIVDQDYSTTNVQVQGVDEPDFLKNDGRYVYILSGERVTIVDAVPAENATVATNQRGGQMSYGVDLAPGQNPHVNYEPSLHDGLHEAERKPNHPPAVHGRGISWERPTDSWQLLPVFEYAAHGSTNYAELPVITSTTHFSVDIDPLAITRSYTCSMYMIGTSIRIAGVPWMTVPASLAAVAPLFAALSRNDAQVSTPSLASAGW